MNDREINIKGVKNIRDLGGLTGLDGRKIKKDLLIRSGRLKDLQEDGLEYFKRINLKTVIDLRTSFEAKESPDPVIEGVDYKWIGVMSEDPEDLDEAAAILANASEEERLILMIKGRFDISRVYIDAVSQPTAIKGMGDALRVIAGMPEGEALLYHCNAGKDRTGTLTAYLLTILGVDMETIMEDFELTNMYFADDIEKLKAFARTITDDPKAQETMAAIGGVSRRNMDIAMAAVVERSGTVMNYITDVLGITDEEIQEIRRKYLEEV